MNYNYITSIIQSAVKRYRGGITSVAIEMGKNPNILSNKLNPNTSSHLLALEEAAEIIKITQDKNLISALASLVNTTIVDLPEPEQIKNIDIGTLLEEFTRANKKCAALGEQIVIAHMAISPGGSDITTDEAAKIKDELEKLISSTFKLQLLIREKLK